MNATPLVKAGILTVVLVAATVISWELYVRSKGFDLSFDDDPALWSDKRRMVYEPADKATVFIGSSRIKFDLDISTWEKITGKHAIQLACVGSNPIPVLEDLAADKNFKGGLVVDVTEVLFFSTEHPNLSSPEKNIKYYKEQTPAQWASFKIDHVLESGLVFLDKDRLSLNATLDNLHIPSRTGVFVEPIFPVDFGRVKFNRQEYMTDRFAADTAMRNHVIGMWVLYGKMAKDPPASGAKLDSLFNVVKTAVDKIRSRGGKVIFVRTPSSGGFLAQEKMGYPREKYWDELLKRTSSYGIHFSDYPVISQLTCPEFSHLSQSDAVLFTKNFIKILDEQPGWKFEKPLQF